MILLLLLSECKWVSGQVMAGSSPPYLSSVNCYSARFVDLFSVTGNAAALTRIENLSIGVYMERRYMLAELSQYSLAAAMPTELGGIGIQLHAYGFAMYRELEPAIGYAKSLGVVDIGVRFNFRMTTIPNYGNSSSFIPELGTVWHVNEKCHTGFRIYNPVAFFQASSQPARIAYSYSSGIGYEVSQVVFVGVTINKEENKRVEVNTAVQYQIANIFFAGIGISNSTTHAQLAFGYQYHALRIQAFTSWNIRLGMSPALALIYYPRISNK